MSEVSLTALAVRRRHFGRTCSACFASPMPARDRRRFLRNRPVAEAARTPVPPGTGSRISDSASGCFQHDSRRCSERERRASRGLDWHRRRFSCRPRPSTRGVCSAVCGLSRQSRIPPSFRAKGGRRRRATAPRRRPRRMCRQSPGVTRGCGVTRRLQRCRPLPRRGAVAAGASRAAIRTRATRPSPPGAAAAQGPACLARGFRQPVGVV